MVEYLIENIYSNNILLKLGQFIGIDQCQLEHPKDNYNLKFSHVKLEPFIEL